MYLNRAIIVLCRIRTGSADYELSYSGTDHLQPFHRKRDQTRDQGIPKEPVITLSIHNTQSWLIISI